MKEKTSCQNQRKKKCCFSCEKERDEKQERKRVLFLYEQERKKSNFNAVKKIMQFVIIKHLTESRCQEERDGRPCRQICLLYEVGQKKTKEKEVDQSNKKK
ncbi:MAG: hypothetical protein A3I05_05150 [Deltaproteobacteria bacterium RIFCSPLOWO2_02_FULL_44_10]|nr:MAG: hypothetical protein A3C46_05905 [Deltaproteobacteria bacterium RIFCSPHIGHO2_02_FULL_44_16]OGQ45978.1 MAG: hypothetical protein A3I05_05150 [Deltaproteobacteria bacterium RIFCSPLOWO2_02_FULL_44_10]